jgi:hypothetical protein
VSIPQNVEDGTTLVIRVTGESFSNGMTLEGQTEYVFRTAQPEN